MAETEELPRILTKMAEGDHALEFWNLAKILSEIEGNPPETTSIDCGYPTDSFITVPIFNTLRVGNHQFHLRSSASSYSLYVEKIKENSSTLYILSE